MDSVKGQCIVDSVVDDSVVDGTVTVDSYGTVVDSSISGQWTVQ